MAFEKVTPLTPELAAQHLDGVAALDPEGLATTASLTETGQAFELQAAGGSGVFVVRRDGTCLWIAAAAGAAADDLTDVGLEFIEEMARAAGCVEVGFQTRRRGLVRKALKRGYTVEGFKLKKKVTP